MLVKAPRSDCNVFHMYVLQIICPENNGPKLLLMRVWSDVFVIKGKPESYTWPILDSGFTNTKYKQYLPPLSSPFWDASFLVHCMKQDDQFDKLLNSKWLFQECGGRYFYIPLSVYFGVRQVFVKRLQCWALDENVTDLFG